MTDIMVDIETMGNTNDSAVVQIGAAVFDRNTGEVGNTFKVNIELQSSMDAGLSVNASTIEWWMNQSKEAQESIFKEPRIPLKNAMRDFQKWIKKNEPEQREVRIWSHATFDFVILSNAFNAVGVSKPWSYKSARDLRTLVDLAQLKWDRNKKNEDFDGVQHDALDDCMNQIKYTVECINKIKVE